MLVFPDNSVVECEWEGGVITWAIWVTAEVRAAIWLVLWPRLPVKAGIPGGLSVDLYTAKEGENVYEMEAQI